jgi:anti-sigma28 factor (negative regulator of flagellin synthesis)
MRIHGERPDGVGQTTSTKVPADNARANRSSEQSARADRVQVSDHARLLSAAIQAAHEAPETSSAAAIERARAKRASGELGKDAERLADKLIDSLLR